MYTVYSFFSLLLNVIFMCLSRGNGSLHEVVLHVALEVEVGKLISGADVQQLAKLAVGLNDATILAILKIVLADVCVNLLAHLRASHLRTSGLAEETGKLITDARGLDEARGLTVARLLLLLARALLGGLELAGDRLLEGLELSLDRGEQAKKLLELGTELEDLGRGRGAVHDDVGDGLSSDYRVISRGCRRGLSSSLALAASGLLGGSRCSGRGNNNILNSGGGRGGGLSSSNHSCYIHCIGCLF